jgi:hypothetical protein
VRDGEFVLVLGANRNRERTTERIRDTIKVKDNKKE